MGTILYQVIGAVILQLNNMMFGMTACVPISTILLFKSENTTLDRPMTLTEISLFSSLSRIGALISTPFMGYLMDRLGRKRCCLLLSGIGVVFWIILAFTRKVEVVIFSVFIAGISAPTFLIVSIYVGEIAEESIRGRLTSGVTISYRLGILTGFLIQEFFEYQMMVYLGALMSLTFMLLLLILKDSPTILMKKGLEKEATKAMAYYRNSAPDSKIVQGALGMIRKTLPPKLEEVPPEEQKLTGDEKSKVPAQTLSKWDFFKQSESTRKAFYLNLFMMASTISQGMLVVQTYVKQIFHEAVPEDVLPTVWCCVLMSVVAVLVGLVGAYLTDRVGRRTLMINASIAVGIFHICLGSQIHLSWGPTWLAAVFVYLFCIAFTLGPGNIPFVLLAELFVPEIKGVIATVLQEFTWASGFTCLFLFNPLVTVIGLGPVFYIFACASFASAAISYFILPETKGLSTDVIQKLFVKEKKSVPA